MGESGNGYFKFTTTEYGGRKRDVILLLANISAIEYSHPVEMTGSVPLAGTVYIHMYGKAEPFAVADSDGLYDKILTAFAKYNGRNLQ